MCNWTWLQMTWKNKYSGALFPSLLEWHRWQNCHIRHIPSRISFLKESSCCRPCIKFCLYPTDFCNSMRNLPHTCSAFLPSLWVCLRPIEKWLQPIWRNVASNKKRWIGGQHLLTGWRCWSSQEVSGAHIGEIPFFQQGARVCQSRNTKQRRSRR